jgi:hypothetical protein
MSMVGGQRSHDVVSGEQGVRGSGASEQPGATEGGHGWGFIEGEGSRDAGEVTEGPAVANNGENWKLPSLVRSGNCRR